ncbi:unnamed protein product [Adineta steineri]|uniref:G-protein coupled receptors family 1 profile domain-containing protein n=1 Tax=Adineta steineri TaxID=433720 RepID=A0A814V0I9_9BILA|nr:unnamed protein product [Adineta steineri]
MASWARTVNPQPYEIAEYIISGIAPIGLIVIGTVGNLLSVLILLKKDNRQTSTNVYLIFLCIMDTLSLYQWNLGNAVYEFTGGTQNISNQSLFLCKWEQFLSFYTLHTSAMFITLVSLDRACLLWSRSYKQKIAQPHIALIFCILVLFILFALNGFLFALGFEYTTYDNNTQTQISVIACYYSLNTGLNNFFSIQYPWIHLVIMYIVPFILMFICTIMTMKKLIVKQTSTNQQLINSAHRNRHISIMLLSMCLTYIISTLPNRLCFSLFTDLIIGHDYTDTVFLITNLLMYTRNALNIFFLYISVHGFRRNIRRLTLTCCRRLDGRIVPQKNNNQTHLDQMTIVHDPVKHHAIGIPLHIYS